MQREEDGGVVISCDFCRTDWDGQAAMVEGHHGSILCLECLKTARGALATGGDDYRCVLCLRENLPPMLPHWSNPGRTDVYACKNCVDQAAKAFQRAKLMDAPATGT